MAEYRMTNLKFKCDGCGEKLDWDDVFFSLQDHYDGGLYFFCSTTCLVDTFKKRKSDK